MTPKQQGHLALIHQEWLAKVEGRLSLIPFDHFVAGYLTGQKIGREEIIAILDEIVEHNQRRALEYGNSRQIALAAMHAAGREFIRAAIKDIRATLIS